jgi:hypothetical protein
MLSDRPHQRIEARFATQPGIIDNAGIAARAVEVRIELVEKASQAEAQLLAINADESLGLPAGSDSTPS